MSSEKAHRPMRQAARHIAERNLPEALQAAEEATKADPANPDAFALLGVAQAHSGLIEEATTSFRRALMLAPTTPRHTYNLGAHLYAQRDMEGARKFLREALRDDPDYAPAKAMLERVYDGLEPGRVDLIVPQLPPEVAVEDAQPSTEPHAIKFLDGMERQWTMAGWALTALSVCAAILLIIGRPFELAAGAEADATRAIVYQSTPLSFVTIVIGMMSILLAMSWMLIDIVDRRGKLAWLIPLAVCCFTGLHALPQAFYMSVRSKLGSQNPL